MSIQIGRWDNGFTLTEQDYVGKSVHLVLTTPDQVQDAVADWLARTGRFSAKSKRKALEDARKEQDG